MTIETIGAEFTICKLADVSMVDFTTEYCFLGKTDEELSLVCPTDRVPVNTTQREDGWRAFRVEGVLDFSLTGILAGLSAVLAQNHIGIFAVSTFNTDYILVKEADFEKALSALSQKGYRIQAPE